MLFKAARSGSSTIVRLVNGVYGVVVAPDLVLRLKLPAAHYFPILGSNYYAAQSMLETLVSDNA